MTQTSDNGGVNHLREKVQNDDQTLLTREEAKEQLLWVLRDQYEEITFVDEAPLSSTTRSSSPCYASEMNEFSDVQDSECNGDGILIAKANGREVDHWVYEGE